MKKITVKTGIIDGKERLMLFSDYNNEVIEQIKTIPGARWHPGEGCWHVSVLAGGVDKLNRLFQGKLLFEIDSRAIGPYDVKNDGQKEDLSGDRAISRSADMPFVREVRLNLVPKEYIKTLTLKNYSPNTIRTYKTMIKEFLEYYSQFDPEKITEEQIRDYLLYLIEEREVINLKPFDIDSARNYVIIRQGKGKKDRYSLLSTRVLDLLRQYYREYQPKEYLFEGQFGGQYSATSIHNILKHAVEKAGIKKRVTVHTLRHAFDQGRLIHKGRMAKSV